MEEEEEPNHSTSLSKYSPLYGVPGWVRNERTQQVFWFFVFCSFSFSSLLTTSSLLFQQKISRCFALNDATSYIWGQDTPQFRPLLCGVSISQISCGSQHVAFLTAMGQVYTFGGFFFFFFFLLFFSSFFFFFFFLLFFFFFLLFLFLLLLCLSFLFLFLSFLIPSSKETRFSNVV